MNKTDTGLLTLLMATAGGLTWWISPGMAKSLRIFSCSFSAVLAAAVFLLLCAVSGCERPLTTQEIAAQSDMCRQHHLKPVFYREGFSPRVVAVQCDLEDR
jgi:hypothetical protein